jgi:hypothetical protein
MKMYLIELSESDTDEEIVIFERLLKLIVNIYPTSNIVTFYRSDGYKNNRTFYNTTVKGNKEDTIIITNDETMLNYMSADLFDNSGLELFIYYPKTKEIKLASELANKELQPEHNILKMYYNGYFDRS